MNIKEEVSTMKAWYDHAIQQFNIFPYLIDREAAVLTAKHRRQDCKIKGVRCLKVTNAQALEYVLNRQVSFSFNLTPIQLYYSLAKYKDGIPSFNPNLNDRKPTVEKWKDDHWKSMHTYDLLIDIDSPDFDHMHIAKHDAHMIANYLVSFDIPFYLRYSGMGYHIIIPHYVFDQYHKHFNPDKIKDSIYEFYNQITQRLHDEFSELIDTDLHDSRRIIKCPYSLACYPQGLFVCWPFKNMWEFLNNDWRSYKLNKELRFPGFENMYKRGDCTIRPRSAWNEAGTREFIKNLKVKT